MNSQRNQYMPLSVLWNYPMVDAQVVLKELGPVNYLKYVAACLQQKPGCRLRPQVEIDYAQIAIKTNNIAGLNEAYIELLIACAKNQSDNLSDYTAWEEDDSEGALESIITLLNHPLFIAAGDQDPRVQCLLQRLKNILRVCKPTAAVLVDALDTCGSWNINDTVLHTTVLKNYLQAIKNEYSIKPNEFLNVKAMTKIVEYTLQYLGEEAYACWSNLVRSRDKKDILPEIINFAAADFVPDQTKSGCDARERRHQFKQILSDIKARNVTIEFIMKRDDYVYFPGFADFNLWMNYWIATECLQTGFLGQMLDEAIHLRGGCENLSWRTGYRAIYRHISGLDRDPKVSLAISQLDFRQKFRINRFLAGNKEYEKSDVTTALLSGLTQEQHQLLSDEIFNRKINIGLQGEVLFRLMRTKTEEEFGKVNPDCKREAQRSIGKDRQAYVHNVYAHTLTPEDSSQQLSNNELLSLQRIPFALAINLLNAGIKLSPAINMFLERFEKANSFAQPEHAVDYSEFMVKYIYKLFNLYEIIGDKLFEVLAYQLATSVLSLTRFLDSYQVLPLSSVEIIRTAASHLNTKNQKLFTDCLLMLVQFITNAKEIKNESGIVKLTFKSLQELYDLLKSLITEQYSRILKLPESAILDMELLQSMMPIMNRVLIGRSRIKEDGFSIVLDAMLAEELQVDGSFNKFISDLDQENPLGKQIAEHNHNIVNLLNTAKINAKLALHYPRKHQFTMVDNGQINVSDLCRAIWRDLLNVENLLITDELSTLANIIQKIKQQICKGKAAEPNLERLLDQTMHAHFKKFTANVRPILENAQCSSHIIEHIRHFDERINHLMQISAGPAKPVLTAYSFTVCQLDKSNKRSLLTGDDVSCCLSPDGGYFDAMIQRRMDVGMPINVVIDDKLQQPVSCVWLFFGYDLKNPEDIYLVANFHEIRAGYGLKPALRERIIAELTEFTAQYAREIGVKGYLIRPLGYGVIPDFSTLDAYQSCMRTIPIQVEKVGGYFDPKHKLNCYGDEEKAKSRYYLQAVHFNQLYLYGKELPLSPESRFFQRPGRHCENLSRIRNYSQ